MIRKQSAVIIIFMLWGINHLFAQVEQDSITTDTHYFLFPEFYHYWPIDKDDTLLKYQCYDADNNLINVDTLHNINNVRHIYFVKSFTNYMHTFIDADGKPKPSSVNKTLYSYDKTDIDSWNSTDYINHYNAQLKEDKNEIVRIDTTVVTDPITSVRQLTIRKYYKVIELKPKDQIEEEK